MSARPLWAIPGKSSLSAPPLLTRLQCADHSQTPLLLSWVFLQGRLNDMHLFPTSKCLLPRVSSCNYKLVLGSAPWKAETSEFLEFKVSLDYIMRPCLKTKTKLERCLNGQDPSLVPITHEEAHHLNSRRLDSSGL